MSFLFPQLTVENIATLKLLQSWNDDIWLYYSYMTIIPLFILYIYKIYFPVRLYKYKGKGGVPFIFEDKIVFVFHFWGILYYIVDLYQMLAMRDFSNCRITYLGHHIASLIFLPTLMYPQGYPWFQLGVCLFHALLFYFPTSGLCQFFYMSNIFLFHYGINQEPYQHNWHHKMSNYVLIAIYLSLFFMAYLDCREL